MKKLIKAIRKKIYGNRIVMILKKDGYEYKGYIDGELTDHFYVRE